MRTLVLSFLMASATMLASWGSVAVDAQVGPAPRSDLPLGDIAAQMTQLDICNFVDENAGAFVMNETKLIDYFSRRQVGSLFNVPKVSNAATPIPTIDEWRAMMDKLYEISSTYGNKIPVLFGLDSVHGANYVFNATLFPQQIGTAATFNRTCAKESGRITGIETRYAGVPWLFSPILGIAVQPSWARVFETFGEDTVVATEMGYNLVKGIQSPPPEGMNEGQWPYTAAACIKHFLGYPDPRTGHDRTPSFIPMNVLLQYFAPPFIRAINGGALSVMENYVEVNGRPTAASDTILNFLLRDMFNFKGMLVSDYNEIYNLADFHYTSENYTEAIRDSFNQTSMDMGMVGIDTPYPEMANVIMKHVRDKRITEARVRESGYRLMELKRKLGVLDGSPVPKKNTTCMFACDDHRKAALDATRQSLTLLQNKPSPVYHKPLLPLDKSYTKIAVVGQACDSIGLMAGGWTIAWQGTSDPAAFGYGTTIRESLTARYPGATVTYSQGCNVTEGSTCGDAYVAESLANAAAAQVVIACIGETHYAEKPGDIDDLYLPGGQIGWVQQLAAANANIVLVLVEGRPRVLGNIASLVPAVLHTYLPGPAGGEAVADVLTGAFNPSGRLPITYPSTINNAPLQYNRRMSANTGGDYNPLWAFGTGLSYTTFALSGLQCSLMPPVGWHCQVSVTNTGDMDGSFSAIFYAQQKWRPIAPEAQRVVGFSKEFIPVGQTVQIEIDMSISAMNYFDEFNCEQASSAPINISVYNNDGTAVSLVMDGYQYRQTACTNWVGWWQQNTGFNYIVPTAAPTTPKAELTEAYFISSVVCFGAGIVGTVILITWLRRRGNQKAGSLLEPSAI